MILNLLHVQNPWWEDINDLKKLKGKARTLYLTQLEKYIPRRQALLLYGLRRTGKTTLLYQIMWRLIQKGMKPTHMLYFSFDEFLVKPLDIILTYEKDILKKRIRNINKVYVFFDEIQKLPNWENQVKILYDHMPNLKIFLSGSASVLLKKHSNESLAGRLFSFKVKPLTFSEFLKWRGITIEPKNAHLHKQTLQIMLNWYLTTGGFPELAQEEDTQFIRRYIRSSVIDAILSRDLPAEFTIKEPELLKRLLLLFLENPGYFLNYSKLASDLESHKTTIMNYVYYLKYALLLREVRNFKIKPRLASRKSPRIYPTNTAFYTAYKFENTVEKSKIYETAVASALEAKYYYRNDFEVDFIVEDKEGKLVPVEVKSGKPDLTQIAKFFKKFPEQSSEYGLVINEEVSDTVQIGNKTVHVMPLWELLLEPPGGVRDEI